MRNLTLTALLVIVGFAGVSHAQLTFRLSEVTGGILVTAEGSLDVSSINREALRFDSDKRFRANNGGQSFVQMLDGAGTDRYVLAGTISSFGTTSQNRTSFMNATGTFDDSIGYSGSRLYLPRDYTTGDLSGSVLFTGITFASEGISTTTPFTQTVTLQGGDAMNPLHQFTVTTAAAVPEPSAFLSLGLIGLICTGRRRVAWVSQMLA